MLGLIAAALALFASEVMRPDLVALVVALTLVLTGTITPAEGFSGFANPAVITVIAMFILSAGLIRTGVADALADLITRLGGSNPVLLTLAVMLTVGVMSAFMNNIGATAILLPAMFAIGKKAGYPPSKLLIPLSFGSLLGGLTTLVGTPPNLLCSMALEEAGFAGFRMFDFAPTGLAVMLSGALFMALVGRHFIPVREQEDLSRSYTITDYLTEVVVPDKSPLVGKTLAEAQLPSRYGLTVLQIRREDSGSTYTVPQPETELQAGDRLIVEGDLDGLIRQKDRGPLRIIAETKFRDEMLAHDELELAEAAVAPRSHLLGQSVNQGHLRNHFGVLVLALRRRGKNIAHKFTSIPLEMGDVLLIQGTPQAISQVAASSDFLVTNRLDHARRDTARMPLALAIMAGAVLTAATGLMHISVAGMLAVLFMALTRCVPVGDMYREVEWRAIFLIALMLPLSIAMDDQHTGTARWLANQVVALTGEHGPLVVMAALFLFTAIITSVMSNAATVVLVAPIGIAIAVGMGIEPHAFLMAIAISASTTFLTPIGHQANVLVYGVGNFRFMDFPRAGALLSVVVFAVTMLVVPLIWPFAPLSPPAPAPLP